MADQSLRRPLMGLYRSHERVRFTKDSASRAGNFSNKQKHDNYVIDYRIENG